MDIKSESTVSSVITKLRKSNWDTRSEERKARRHRTKLRIAKRKRGQ